MLIMLAVLLWSLLYSAVSARVCLNRTIDILVSARNGVFDNLTTPETNIQATDFALDASTQGFNGTMLALTDYATVSGRYRMSCQYCRPSNATGGGNGSAVLQILTHGIGYDKVYVFYAPDICKFRVTDSSTDIGISLSIISTIPTLIMPWGTAIIHLLTTGSESATRPMASPRTRSRHPWRSLLSRK